DPRPDFRVARLHDGVEDIRDLTEGMLLEGTVSNVAAFGAFIDLGVHQDGLVHVSQLSHKFVTDAREVVKTGDIVKVQVIEVDVARKRISLTMKLGAPPARRDGSGQGTSDNRFQGANAQQRARPIGQNSGALAGPGRAAGNIAPQSTAMSSAFAKLKGLG
ncbi:MAG TPA: S1 RNA-binding domain-containing protein, partial [Rhodoferax sp.]|nr:S1 RNA-binding domain-containing protein [Rhodoferax sp.]